MGVELTNLSSCDSTVIRKRVAGVNTGQAYPSSVQISRALRLPKRWSDSAAVRILLEEIASDTSSWRASAKPLAGNVCDAYITKDLTEDADRSDAQK